MNSSRGLYCRFHIYQVFYNQPSEKRNFLIERGYVFSFTYPLPVPFNPRTRNEAMMSRTFKDRPYALIEDEARSRGFSHTYDCGRFHWEYVEVAKYAYSRKRNPHIPARRWEDWRWIEDDWYTDYGNETRIRDSLSIAVNTYNSGMMNEDWDEPNVYQRRRRWYC